MNDSLILNRLRLGEKYVINRLIHSYKSKPYLSTNHAFSQPWDVGVRVAVSLGEIGTKVDLAQFIVDRSAQLPGNVVMTESKTSISSNLLMPIAMMKTCLEQFSHFPEKYYDKVVAF